MRHLLVLSLGVLLSCSGRVGSGSLKVVVTVEAGLKSRCAKVVARGADERESTRVLLADRTSFTVGVSQNDEPVDTEVQAIGFSDDGCTRRTVPAETSELRAARFASPAAEVALTLRLEPVAQADGGSDAGVDRDVDGWNADVDCDDGNAAISPGAAELCGNAVDDDCDGFLDCMDPQCDLQPCGAGGQCRVGGCVAPNETGLCFDGLDNDVDGTVDCDDTDCPQGARCSDSNACTLLDACGGPDAGCVRGADAVCDQPPAAQCFTPVGLCLPDAGGACSYAVTSGTCMDGLACTDNDTCTADGGCVGTPRVCGPPPLCRGPGACNEAMGACVFPPLVTGVCSDGDNCTVNDGCDGDGGCAGTRVSCVAPAECLTVASTCEVDGGCIFTPRGGACDGGTCNGAGACVTTPPLFAYPPSNFTEAQLPPSAGAVVVNCNVTINTSTPDGGVSWTTCASGVSPPAFNIIPAGANTAVLLFMDALTINGGAVVSAIGARPLIVAVQGAVVINGTLTAGSAGARGAGSDIDCVTGAGSPGTASGTPETAGGGGGGGFLTDGTDGSDGLNGGPKGAKGSSNGIDTLIPLRGGCRGGNGGRTTGTGSGSGRGGRGGGAVQVSSGGALTINTTGTISAPGEGGMGGAVDQRIGGGGGGAGGAILLEAMTLTVNAGGAVVANGGAGAEGSGWGGNPYSGVDGQDGQRGLTRALCLAFVCGGNGGSGGALTGPPTQATTGGTAGCAANAPGGGGGGSAGRVRLNAVNGCTFNAAVISPARTGMGTGCQ